MALFHVHHHADTLAMNMNMDVVLPDALGMRRGRRGKAGKLPAPLPVVFLLHGMSDDHSIWQRRTAIERYASDRGMAVVMPTTHLGWYTDSPYNNMKYFTYITRELPELCRRMFPCISASREDTFAAGLSMGGYGAMKCALRAPDTFSRAVSLSGGLDIINRLGKQGREGAFWTDLFGPADQAAGGFDDLFAAAEELATSGRELPGLYLWCGTEDFLYQGNLRMRDHLAALGYPLRYSESPGDHQWLYWDREIQPALDWLLDKEAV